MRRPLGQKVTMNKAHRLSSGTFLLILQDRLTLKKYINGNVAAKDKEFLILK